MELKDQGSRHPTWRTWQVNPFNGIESYVKQPHTQPPNNKRIHSMELKDRVRQPACYPSLRRGNPFNGIERVVGARFHLSVEAPLTNPFNGIERGGL